MERRQGRRIKLLCSILIVIILLLGSLSLLPGWLARMRAARLPTGTEAKNVCFSQEALPDEFALFRKAILDNADAAKGTFDPQQREREYAQWGRVTGAVLQWHFDPPSMPEEDADGLMTEEELAAAYGAAQSETGAAPFAVASCRVDLYRSSEGARLAFAATVDNLRQPGFPAPPTALETARPASVTELASPPHSDESIALAYRYDAPALSTFIITFRTANRIGLVSVSAPCDTSGGQPCDAVEERSRALARLLDQRSAATPPEPSSGLAAAMAGPASEAERAAQLCPQRDHSGCIKVFISHTEASPVVALCRTEYGGWFFEPPRGDVGHLCSDDESTIVAVTGRP